MQLSITDLAAAYPDFDCVFHVNNGDVWIDFVALTFCKMINIKSMEG